MAHIFIASPEPSHHTLSVSLVFLSNRLSSARVKTNDDTTQALPPEARPLCTPEEKAALPPLKDDSVDAADDDGGNGAGGSGGIKTAGELARLCYEDPCKGLLEVCTVDDARYHPRGPVFKA